jgi:hypothetical protein
LPNPDGQSVFSTVGPDRRPWLQLQIGGCERTMLIDSGAPLSALVVNGIDNLATKAPPCPVGASTRFKEVEVRRGARLDGNAVFGLHHLVEPTLASTKGTELIGGEVLRHFVISFDRAQRRVRFLRVHASTPITFAPVISHGMALVPNDGNLVVREVFADGPAIAAGLVPGDRITPTQGVEVAKRGCESLASGSLVVRFVRDGKIRETTIEMRVLVK